MVVASAERTTPTDVTSAIEELAARLLAEAPPAEVDDREFWATQFDMGLARVDAPEGLGGLDLDRGLQQHVDALLRRAGAPRNEPLNLIGVQMAMPLLLQFGTDEQRRTHLRRAFVCEEIWCQLFSEPDAGSDLASLATRAVRDGAGWRITGQKVWTTCAHIADRALLLARTDPQSSRHAGLTFFILDMREPGVEVRPLRQITGEAEYNEVFLSEVYVPDEARVGGLGQGWTVAMQTLANERESSAELNEATQQMLASAVAVWRSLEHSMQTAVRRDQLVQLWIDAKIFDLLVRGGGARTGAGGPMVKLQYASLWQRVSGLCMDLRGAGGLLVDDYEMTRPDRFTSTYEVDLSGIELAKAFLASQALSIAGGTTNINKNVIAERTLGLPR